LIVDDDSSVVKVLAEMLRPEGYHCLESRSGQDALRLMNIEGIDVVLCDVQMPGMSGLELLRVVRAKHFRLGFVIITGEGDIRVGVQAMKDGADDYLLKPLDMGAVLVSVDQVLERKKLEAELENHRLHLAEMVEERTAQLRRAKSWIEQTCEETLQALAGALDLRDSETAGHSQRVMAYAVRIGMAMGCSKEQLNTIARGALLHDVGKIGIPDAILLKTSPLSEYEREVMETHAVVGFSVLKRIAFLGGSAEIVLTHHERYDGTGYPQGFAGKEIPLGARIFAVADTLDAMTSDRPYRRAGTFAAAREEIIRESEKQFDPEVVSAFLAIDERTWPKLRSREGFKKSLGIEARQLVPRVPTSPSWSPVTSTLKPSRSGPKPASRAAALESPSPPKQITSRMHV
jgi:response regulator RpfG family c-di-GMP phosphodiesterase